MATTQEQAAVVTAMLAIENPVIVELGAYRGEEYQWLRALNPARYIAVEADPQNVPWLQNAIGEHAQVVHCAIADHSNGVELHQCHNDASQAAGSSSIRKPTGHLHYFPWCGFREPMRVPSLRLDDLWKLYGLGFIDLIWCDIQGAERDMIAGGHVALGRTRYLMIEAEEVEMYDGQATKPELLAMLPDWEVIGDFGYNLLLKNRKL